MNFLRSIGWIIFLTAVALLFSCNRSVDENPVIQHDFNETQKADTIPLFEEERAVMRERLNEQTTMIDKRISNVRADLAAAKDNTQTTLQEKAEALEQQREDIKARQKQVDDATEATWEEIKTEINAYLETLDNQDYHSGMEYKY